MRDGSQPPKRKRGGQPGNTNAIKHGRYANLYERVLGESDRKALAIAREMSVRDLEAEADIVRVLIQKILGTAKEKADDEPGTTDILPKDLPVLAEMMRTLCRVAATHYNLNKQQAEDLEDAMFNVFADIRTTMGE